ncbi:MAG: cob(I)yrinic acid a,c-diamide adenosyltransferase [Candidatus Nitrohelix vancouverensis]|uniref:Corrinoid adenosyltransferase n=1 Tax=Candidatus Nitrohelix vancouverensis TaxID=2705534 RepID=A0A7T0C3I9_9BACT|nr:MAG: cob(I)yrinic acid a,c-diamide adenosyltransferase [Candidatus Nitrohelix vancouverensis]
MVSINRVYTKKGDGGETALVGGIRVAKDCVRVETYGTVDELNTVIGIARTFNIKQEESQRRDKLDIILECIQQRLFDIGSILATVPGTEKALKKEVSPENVEWLEQIIDLMNVETGKLKSFTLPGGGPVSAFLHQARTVCRRAERQIIRLRREEEVPEQILPYINRLSDALFVFSRWATLSFKEPEFLWIPNKGDPDDWKWD